MLLPTKPFIGTNSFDDIVDRIFGSWENSSYPPYNIESISEDEYKISIAVAGFSSDEIAITQKKNVLCVEGKKLENHNTSKYLHKGIADRKFSLKFALSDHMKVESAKQENGLLHIVLFREIPEEFKPIEIKIEDVTKKALLE